MKIPPVELNKTYPLIITDLTSSGEGVAHLEGFTIFVDETVPGDEVTAQIETIKPQYAKAKVNDFQKFSKNRIEEKFCPYQEECGGCSYYLLNYNAQLDQKQKQIKDALEKVGGFKDLEIFPIKSSKPAKYRNKAQYQVRENGIGFFKKGSHELIDLNSCRLQSDKSNEILKQVERFLEKNHIKAYNEEKHTGLVRGILIRTNQKEEASLTLIVNTKNFKYKKQLVDYFKNDPDITGIYINYNTNKGNTILGKNTEQIYYSKDLTEKLGDKTYRISPTAFFQVNTEQAKVLYDVVREFADLKGDEKILDLYCGTGTIGIYLCGPNNNLTGIEVNEQAISDAHYNSKLNDIENAEFLIGNAEDFTDQLDESYDLVILDPPRKGCDKKLINFLLKKDFPKIIYISCNPATLARDLKELKQKYNIEKIQPVDLFPQTGHVETVCLLVRK